MKGYCCILFRIQYSLTSIWCTRKHYKEEEPEKICISTVWATRIKNWHNRILCRLYIVISQKMYNKNTSEFHLRQVFNKVQEGSLPYYKWFMCEIITLNL